MTARNVGKKVGRGVGIVGAALWNTTCRIAAATGEAGEGFMEGTEQGWDEAMKKEAQRKVDAKAKMLALLAEQGATATPMVAA